MGYLIKLIDEILRDVALIFVGKKHSVFEVLQDLVIEGIEVLFLIGHWLSIGETFLNKTS